MKLTHLDLNKLQRSLVQATRFRHARRIIDADSAMAGEPNQFGGKNTHWLDECPRSERQREKRNEGDAL